jgi:tryptophan synthase beta chain
MIIPIDTKDIPEKWYNLVPDLDLAIPPLIANSGYPLSIGDLEPVTSHAIINQEFEEKKREIPIPEAIRELYTRWRPTPLLRAERLEAKLGTPARIFFKYEGNTPSGSHEINTAAPQVYYASEEGARRVITATGNAQWGAALASICNYFNVKCTIYMVRPSYEASALGRSNIETLGAEIISSPSDNTRAGRKELAKDPASPGSLSIALSEAFEDASQDKNAKFIWSSVMKHTIIHQSVIGLEAQREMWRASAVPDIFISAVSGGSAFGGLVFPFYRFRYRKSRMIAVEASAAPSLSKGQYRYDYGDAGGLSFMLKMYTLGHSLVPPDIRAGSMRYHGVSPLISALYREQKIEVKTCTQRQALRAALVFARTEGIIPSLESAYAIKVVIDEATACKKRKEAKNILFLLDADNNFELATYNDFLKGEVPDQTLTEEKVQAALEELPPEDIGLDLME